MTSLAEILLPVQLKAASAGEHVLAILQQLLPAPLGCICMFVAALVWNLAVLGDQVLQFWQLARGEDAQHPPMQLTILPFWSGENSRPTDGFNAMAGPVLPSKAWLLGKRVAGEDGSDCSSQEYHSLSVFQLPGAWGLLRGPLVSLITDGDG